MVDRQVRLRSLHRTLADPLRIRLLEYLWFRPQTVKELAERVSLRPDRLYHHLAQLESAGLIEITEYRRLPGGKVERVYAPTAAEPPGDDASPVELAQFLTAAMEATRADITSAGLAKEAGKRRELSLTRTAVQLSDKGLADLVAGFEQLIEQAHRNSDGTGAWTRIVWAVVDVQDRDPAMASGESPASDPQDAPGGSDSPPS
jgi:DNA-binding transcriptional ArsR family regulator